MLPERRPNSDLEDPIYKVTSSLRERKISDTGSITKSLHPGPSSYKLKSPETVTSKGMRFPMSPLSMGNRPFFEDEKTIECNKIEDFKKEESYATLLVEKITDTKINIENIVKSNSHQISSVEDLVYLREQIFGKPGVIEEKTPRVIFKEVLE